NGVLDAPSSSKERNERERISTTLAPALGGGTVPADGGLPQIRIVVDTHMLANGHPGTGVFSIFEVYPSADSEVQVYADADASDEDSGQYRLFEDVVIGDLSTVRVTAHGVAPSRTTIDSGGGPSVSEPFCEPHLDAGLTEDLTLTADPRLALLVPHGGEIEAGTSEMVAPMETVLSHFGVTPHVWDVQGIWHGGTDESEHWHITSNEVGEHGFPGLAALDAAPDFDASRDVQYAVSLHGMRYDHEGILLGGRAHREAKCLIASLVRERMAAEGLPVPAAYVWDVSGELADSVEVPHSSDPAETITSYRGDDPGLSGRSTDNVVNRYSPNADGTAGFGGIQIEASPSLRDDALLPQFLPAEVSYRDLVAEEIGHALGELITRPNLFDPQATLICDALAAGEPTPVAAIEGRVFWDDDGDDLESAGDRPAEGLGLELVGAGDIVVATTATDSEGAYAFRGLGPGTFRVRALASPAVAFVPPGAGGEAVDSDFGDGQGPEPLATTAAIVLATGELVSDVDAGLVLAAGTATVGDFIWIDTGTDLHLQDAADGPLEGVTVELFDAGGLRLATTASDGGGFYSFAALPAATYTLRLAPPVGYQAVTALQGASNLDSDFDAQTLEASVTLAPGETHLDLDAGFVVGCVDATLVAFGSAWTWSQTYTAGWQALGFGEAGWNTPSLAPFGSRSSAETTVPAATTTYFRLAFEVEDPTLFDGLDFSLFREDGAVIHLNGVEIWRQNVPTSGYYEDFDNFSVASPGVQLGTNVLAVEVERRGSHLTFDLEVSATLCRPCVGKVEIDADRGTYVHLASSLVRGNRTFVGADSGGNIERALFGWPMAALPADAEVLHAAITWEVTDDSSDTFHLYPLERAWKETEAEWILAQAGSLWSTAGAADSTADFAGDEPVAAFEFDDSEFGPVPFLGTVVLNVDGRSLVQAWARGERANHGLIAEGAGHSDNRIEITSDDGATPPNLEVVYHSCTPP
ncbi:MAG: DNRLRE domain-containing protein, partial [Holophagales bacterium]|nr:DNRLRE domain-containing protein [Holophagales bacterium]